jgi:hypothetical protein
MLCYDAHYKAVITGIQSVCGQHLDQGKKKGGSQGKKEAGEYLPAITTICTYNVAPYQGWVCSEKSPPETTTGLQAHILLRQI